MVETRERILDLKSVCGTVRYRKRSKLFTDPYVSDPYWFDNFISYFFPFLVCFFSHKNT
jgi:hypothetical protein